MHLGSHPGENNALCGEIFEFERGGLILFASTLRHPALAQLLGVLKHVVLFHHLTRDESHVGAHEG